MELKKSVEHNIQDLVLEKKITDFHIFSVPWLDTTQGNDCSHNREFEVKKKHEGVTETYKE